MALLENSPVSLPTGRPEASYADETAPVAVHDADFQNFFIHRPLLFSLFGGSLLRLSGSRAHPLAQVG